MNLLLAVDRTTVGMVNAAVIVLIIVFLTLPTVFVLAEYLRNRRSRTSASSTAHVVIPQAQTFVTPPPSPSPPAPAAAPMADTRPDWRVTAHTVHDAQVHEAPRSIAPPAFVTSSQSPPAYAPAPTPVADAFHGLRVVFARSVAHDFTREAVPPEIGYLPSGQHVDGDVGFAGHLQLAPRSTVTGDIDVTGSLAVGDGAYCARNVSATGNVYLGRGARVRGEVRAGGSVFLVNCSQAGAVHATGPVELEAGARVDEVLEAVIIQHVDRVHDPLVRARQGVRVATVPTA